MSMDYDRTPGDYTYRQTEYGKQVDGVVKNGATSARNPNAQKEAGGADKQPGDHAGHLFAHSIGGRNDATNLDAQAANVNQIDQAHVERNVRALAADPDKTVALEVRNFNSTGERPDATMMNVGVRDNTTGEIDEAHYSFQNASHAEQQEWNDIANQCDTEIDPSQDAGMTEEQRAEANELCGEENTVDDRLGSGYIYSDFDTSFLDVGAGPDGGMPEGDVAGLEGGEAESMGTGLDGGAEDGVFGDSDGGESTSSGGTGTSDGETGDSSGDSDGGGFSGGDDGDDHGR